MVIYFYTMQGSFVYTQINGFKYSYLLFAHS